MEETIYIRMTPTDLASIRFAYSPMMEVAFSLFACDMTNVIVNPRWQEESKRALYNMELPYMHAVIPPNRYVADFITPTPDQPIVSLQDDLDAIRATPPEVVRGNIEKIIQMHGETPERLQFLAYPMETVECLIEEIQVYWNRVLAHHWERIVVKLDDDIAMHARQMALHGTPTMLNELSEMIKFDEDTLRIEKKINRLPQEQTDYDLNGSGLILVPNVFKAPNGSSWQIVPEYMPMVIYGAYGGGLWYHAAPPDPERDLVLTLGEGRAKVLLALRTPAPTSELARTLDMTSGAASQHLKRLGEAGLVRAQRRGYYVYYALSDRGEKLLNVFENS